MTAPERAEPDQNTANHTLRRLLDVSLVLNANLALLPLLHYLMDAASEITNSESASILQIDKRTRELYFIATNTPNAEQMMVRIPVPLEGSVAGTIVRENRAVVIQDATNDPHINRTVDKRIAFQTRSLMGVPMRIKNDVIGAIEVVNRKGSSPWTDEDCAHLTILAAQAAVALENAEQAEDLRKAYDELSKVDKLKNDFIAIASHELRTPLSIIIGYASFLQEEAQGTIGEHATTVLNAAQHLGQIIEDMVNLRYLRISGSELTLEPTLVTTLVETARREIEPLAAARSQRIEWRTSDLTETVNADAPKLEMALTNVLNNAVKFTPTGGKIVVYSERRGSELWLRVADSGIGIPADQLEEIFKDFYQVSEHMTRQYNGMGLGLSIARAVVQAHGGRIWAESKGQGQGSVFTVCLPVA